MFRDTSHGLLRLQHRLPIHVYRLGLGWTLGHRFLLLTHRGRRTGLPRQAMLEVIHYDPRTQESTVLAALGERADWYRNIQAGPAIEVRTGRCRYVPQYRVLTPEEAEVAWRDFQQARRWEARLAAPVLRLERRLDQSRATRTSPFASSGRLLAEEHGCIVRRCAVLS